MLRTRLFLVALAALSSLSAAHATDSITLHFYRSPGLNWYGPRALAKSVYRARNKAFPIGHVTIDLECGGRFIRTGMAEARPGEAQSLVRGAKYGLGILFHSSIGELEELKPWRKPTREFPQGEPLIDYYLRAQSEGTRLKALKINVSADSCKRMVDYYDTYRTRGMKAWYGLLSRPLYGEGGGCSAYAMGFLEAGGLRQDWMIQDWANFVRVQSGVIGGPLTRDSVGFLGLMLSGDKRWSSIRAKHFPVFFYDPDLMWSWLDTLQRTGSAGHAGRIPYKPFAFGKGGGIEIDMSAIKPDMTKPIFYSMTGDPRLVAQAAARDPKTLYSHWAPELEIWEKAHPNGMLDELFSDDDSAVDVTGGDID